MPKSNTIQGCFFNVSLVSPVCLHRLVPDRFRQVFSAAQTQHQAGAVKVERRDYTNRPPVLAPLRRALPSGAAARPFACIQMVLSQEYSSNRIEVVLGWTGELKAGPCLPGLWLAQSLLLYIKYYFWRMGGKMWEGEGCGSTVPRLISGTLLQVIERF